MSIELYLAYLMACLMLAFVPGPNVTLVVATGLRHGTAAAMQNILGTQIGLGIIVAVLAAGLSAAMATMGVWFDWIRLAGAAYLVWLGIRLINEAALTGEDHAPVRRPAGGFVGQGLTVVISNPKVLLFYGAFIPQFIGADGHRTFQILLLGFTFNLVAGVTDIAYALLAGRARAFVSIRRMRVLSRVSGGLMISGGIWLAFSRVR